MADIEGKNFMLKTLLKEKLEKVMPDLLDIWHIIGVLPALTFGESQISKWHTLEGAIVDLKEWLTKLTKME